MCVVFFKQKTAYEMRISDWSSDVCSSDLIEHQARLNHAASCLAVDCDQPVQMLGEVDDHGAVHGLAALRGASAARQHRHASLAGDGERCLNIDPGLRHHHAERNHLLDRGLRPVTPEAEAIEKHPAHERWTGSGGGKRGKDTG